MDHSFLVGPLLLIFSVFRDFCFFVLCLPFWLVGLVFFFFFFFVSFVFVFVFFFFFGGGGICFVLVLFVFDNVCS